MLEGIIASKNEIVEISGLEGLEKLEGCLFSHNHLKSTCGFETNVNLHNLSLDNNQIQTIEGFKNLSQLVELDLSNNLLDSMAGLAGCSALKTLDLSHNNIQSIEGLMDLKHLDQINLSKNQLASIDGIPWDFISDKFVLDVSSNRLTTLTFYTGFDILYANNNQISTITYEPLPSWRSDVFNFYAVNLACNEITTLDVLKHVITDTRGEPLDLMGNPIADVSALNDVDPRSFYYVSDDRMDPAVCQQLDEIETRREEYRKNNGYVTSHP
jgi:Leucine-rich repeat (LRR) protein